MKELLIEICEPESLKDSKGVDLPGKELKRLKLETITERELRKNSERIKEVKKTVRYGRLLEESACLLNREIREGIKELGEKYKLSEKEKDELVVQAKEKCFKFEVELAKQFQHYLPLSFNDSGSQVSMRTSFNSFSKAA